MLIRRLEHILYFVIVNLVPKEKSIKSFKKNVFTMNPHPSFLSIVF